MQLFHQNYVYGSACISNLRQGTNYGLRMRLKRTDCSCTGLGNVVAELESRYMLMYGPLSESSIPVGNMQAGLRWRWPQSGVITLDYSDFLVTFNPDPVITAHPNDGFLVSGKGMDEILKSMDVHSTETSQADYKLSSLASIRLAVRVPFMLKMAGEELSNFVSKGYRDL